MANELDLTIVYEPGEDGWIVASIPDRREREPLHLTIAA
jgi:hypothetical protein